MEFHTLISAEGLAKFIDRPDWVVVDCRFSLDNPEKGYQDYLNAHIPGAVYAHLDKDLSGKVIPGETGRHPLPNRSKLAKKFGSWGIGDHHQVVAYDDNGGMIAARLWWLLRWLGHDQVAVLDGGIQAWVEYGEKVSKQIPKPKQKEFTPQAIDELTASADEILTHFGDPNYLLVDSRAPERYLGENEPIDPIAGRIPGAINHFWLSNLDTNKHFAAKDILRGRFEALSNGIPSDKITFYCGSGVTAAHNILAMAHAGFGLAKLYPGSWSHWITDAERPILSGG